MSLKSDSYFKYIVAMSSTYEDKSKWRPSSLQLDYTVRFADKLHLQSIESCVGVLF